MNSNESIVRAVVEADDATVAETLEKDHAGRSADIVSFVQLLDRIDGNYSIFLDAPWGAGKTFFVKEVAAVLRDGNELARTSEGVGATLAKVAGISGLHLPVYFNAWECDYRDEPVASLIETLVDGFSELKGKELFEAGSGELLRSVLNSLDVSLGVARFSPGKLADGAASEDVTLPLRRDRDVRTRLMSMFDEIVVEKAERVALFIDELDRCRPSYAVRLLEAVKFLFDHKRLTVVFSVDFPMLAQAVRGCYGPGFDGEAYLSRFYDMRFRLPDVSYENRLRLDGYSIRGNTKLWDTARAVIAHKNMSLRDQQKYTALLRDYSARGAAREGYADEGVAFARNVMGPLLLCCQMLDPDLLERFLSADAEGFRDFWAKFSDVEFFAREVQSYCALAKGLGISSADSPEEVFVSCLCPELFGIAGPNDVKTALLSANVSVAEGFSAALRFLHLR